MAAALAASYSPKACKAAEEGQRIGVRVTQNGSSTVVEVRYTLADLHSASFYEQETGTFLGMAYYREGDTITIPTSIQREGYVPVFADLGEDETPTMGENDVSFTIRWVPTEGGYTVEHYLQGEDGEYVLDRRTSVPGEAGDPVSDTIQLLNPAGYRKGEYEDAVIAEDGDTVVEVYYDRYVATFVNDSTEYITPDKEVGKVYFLSGSPAITPPVVTGTDSSGEEVNIVSIHLGRGGLYRCGGCIGIRRLFCCGSKHW